MKYDQCKAEFLDGEAFAEITAICSVHGEETAYVHMGQCLSDFVNDVRPIHTLARRAGAMRLN